jgi:hypothetical protein
MWFPPQLVPAVTELMVAELLYLEKQGTSLPIEMLINSSGTTRQDGEIVGINAQQVLAAHAMMSSTVEKQRSSGDSSSSSGPTWAVCITARICSFVNSHSAAALLCKTGLCGLQGVLEDATVFTSIISWHFKVIQQCLDGISMQPPGTASMCSCCSSCC